MRFPCVLKEMKHGIIAQCQVEIAIGYVSALSAPSCDASSKCGIHTRHTCSRGDNICILPTAQNSQKNRQRTFRPRNSEFCVCRRIWLTHTPLMNLRRKVCNTSHTSAAQKGVLFRPKTTPFALVKDPFRQSPTVRKATKTFNLCHKQPPNGVTAPPQRRKSTLKTGYTGDTKL